MAALNGATGRLRLRSGFRQRLDVWPVTVMAVQRTRTCYGLWQGDRSLRPTAREERVGPAGPRGARKRVVGLSTKAVWESNGVGVRQPPNVAGRRDAWRAEDQTNRNRAVVAELSRRARARASSEQTSSKSAFVRSAHSASSRAAAARMDTTWARGSRTRNSRVMQRTPA